MLLFKEWLLTTEMFDSSMPIRWTKKTSADWEGDFQINGKHYLIKMMNEPHMGWEVKFELLQDGKYTQDITGTGDAVVVLSTVVKAIHYWIAQVKPHAFALSAREPSRAKLYARMLKSLPRKWHVENMGGVFFVRDSTVAEPAYATGFDDDGLSDFYDDY